MKIIIDYNLQKRIIFSIDYWMKINCTRIIFEKSDFLAKNRASFSIIKNNRDYCMNIFHWEKPQLAHLWYLWKYISLTKINGTSNFFSFCCLYNESWGSYLCNKCYVVAVNYLFYQRSWTAPICWKKRSNFCLMHYCVSVIENSFHASLY